MLHAIGPVVAGFVSGLVARAILSGGDRMGLLRATAAGIAGPLIVGFPGRIFRRSEPEVRFQHAGFIGAVLPILRQMK